MKGRREERQGKDAVNRTKVELKYGITYHEGDTVLPVNRTKVELK